MTTTFTLDEALRNQTLAALDERAARLELAIRRSKALSAEAAASEYGFGLIAIDDIQRALVWSIAALHETKLAREQIGEAPPSAPDPITEAKRYEDWTSGELVVEFGK